jgi:ribosomal protein S18 acetylase RimI-like enzyme
MNIRPYSPADWDRLCVIHDAARLHELEAAGLIDAFLSLEQTAENEGLFAGQVLVAESSGRVHGFVAFTQHELTWLYVDPGKARQGIGRQLLRRAIEACAGNLSTEVLVGNEPALALYQSEGFVILRRSDGRLTGNEAYAASGYLLQHTASEAEPGVGYDCGTAP